MLSNRFMKIVIIVIIIIKYLLNFFFLIRNLEEQFFTVWLFFQISSSWGIINLQKRSLACFLSFLVSLLFSMFCWFGQWADWKVYREEAWESEGWFQPKDWTKRVWIWPLLSLEQTGKSKQEGRHLPIWSSLIGNLRHWVSGVQQTRRGPPCGTR